MGSNENLSILADKSNHGDETRKRKKPSSDESDSSFIDNPEDAVNFVLVIDPSDNNETVGIQLSEDGTLSIAALDHTFPGAYGLTYMNQSIGYKCGVLFDDWKNALLEPPGGWAKRKYQLIFKPKLSPAASAVSETISPFPPNQESSRPGSPWSVVHYPLPKPPSFDAYIFYILEEDRSKSCVTAINKNYFVTYRHGPHSSYELGIEKQISRHNDSEVFTATVKLISTEYDFVLLKDKDPKPINNREPYHCRTPFKGLPICLFGYGNEFKELCYLSGDVHSDEKYMFVSEENGEIMGPFLLGTIEATYGDSGASVWSSEGLIGLNVGKTKFPDHSHQYAIDEAANFKPKNVMVTIDKINEALTRLELEAKETSPKKSAMCFDVVKGSGVYKGIPT